MGLNEKDWGPKHTMFGCGVLFVGFILYLFVRGDHGGLDNFWLDYIRAIRGTAYMAMLFGAIWGGLGLLQWQFDFFNVKRAMEGDAFMIVTLVTIAAIVLLLFIIIPRLPPDLPQVLPEDPEERVMLLRQHANIRLLFATALSAFGLGLLSFPARRFFSH